MLIAKNEKFPVSDCNLDSVCSHHCGCSVLPDPVICKKSDCWDMGISG